MAFIGTSTSTCQTAAAITGGTAGGSIVYNSDGTLSVFVRNQYTNTLTPTVLTKPCCEALGLNGVYFDVDNQDCRWSSDSTQSCSLDTVFKLVINPKGNDGSIFYVDGDENCYLTIDFDYLFKFDCKTLSKLGIPQSTIPSSPIPFTFFSPSLPTVFSPSIPPSFGGGGSSAGGVSGNIGGVGFTNSTNGIGFGSLPSIGSSSSLTALISSPTINSTPISPIIAQQQGVNCQQLENRLATLNAQLSTTFYSIICSSTPFSPTNSTPSFNLGFLNTGFGTLNNNVSVSENNPSPTTSNISIGQNYCLSEPNGLNEWAKVLGPVRYQKFLAGDPTSYTCVDVRTISDLNQTIINANLTSPVKSQLYLTPCNTPFGAKTQLLKDIEFVTQEISNCNSTLILLDDIPTTPNIPIFSAQIPTATTTTTTATFGTTTTPTPTPTIPNISIGISNPPFNNPVSSGICTSAIQALENLDVSFTLDVVESSPSGETLVTVYEGPLFPKIGDGNLYNYITTNSGQTGFYICGDPIIGDPTNLTSCSPMNFNSLPTSNVYSCNQLRTLLKNQLFVESGLPNTLSGQNSFNNSISNNAFISQWLHFSSIVNDVNVLTKIKNKKIKISLKINDACVDFCVLLDSIKLEKICTLVDKNELLISQSPGFSLERIRDNKKSWLNNMSRVHRDFSIKTYNNLNPIRPTDYYPNDERLVINSKEIDLDISLASAIETDVWCYMNDNDCLLTAITQPCSCVVTGTTTSSVALGSLHSQNAMVGFLNPYQFGNTAGVSFEQDFVNNLVSGSYYTITYTISNMTGGSVGVSLFLTGNTFTKFDQIRTSNGTYTLTKQYLGVVGSNVFCVNEQSSSPLTRITVDSIVQLTTSVSNCCPDSCCGDNSVDYSKLLTQPLSAITVVEDFQYYMTSELIDAKDRKTLSAYPTLRGVYDRYLNSNQYCPTTSAKFDYETMDQFSKLIGNYWVDIIEQVVPATTIWGSTKVYSNTIFDGQKFKYKSYTLLLGGNSFSSYTLSSPTTACTSNVNVVTTTVGSSNTNNTYTYNKICIAQMNSGSEFVGTVSVVGNSIGSSGGINFPYNPNFQIYNAF